MKRNCRAGKRGVRTRTVTQPCRGGEHRTWAWLESRRSARESWLGRRGVGAKLWGTGQNSFLPLHTPSRGLSGPSLWRAGAGKGPFIPCISDIPTWVTYHPVYHASVDKQLQRTVSPKAIVYISGISVLKDKR